MFGWLLSNNCGTFSFYIPCVLRCVCECVYTHEPSCVWLFAILWTGSTDHGFSRQEYWRGLPFPPPGYLSDPAIEPKALVSPALAAEFFTTQPPGKSVFQPTFYIITHFILLPCLLKSFMRSTFQFTNFLFKFIKSCLWPDLIFNLPLSFNLSLDHLPFDFPPNLYHFYNILFFH